MSFYKITARKGRQLLGTVEGDDIAAALDVLALKSGFWDFRDLAASMDVTPDKAREGLIIVEVPGPTSDHMTVDGDPEAVPELAVM